MRIACIGYLHGAGGAERQIIMLANAMAEKGHEVHMIVLADFKSNYVISNKIIIHDLSDMEKNNCMKIVNRYLILKKVLKSIKPDISVHYWLQSAYFCVFMPSQITGRIIYSERGDPGDSEYTGLLGVIRDITLKKVQGIVFQSEGARDYFGKNIIEKSVIIHNSISIPEGEYLKACENREKKIVNVGRLHSQKNQQLLIEAFSKIEKKFPEYYVEIYGAGNLEKELKQKIKSLNLENKVFLRGTKTNILDYIYNASVFVLTSDYEGMPNALMEAMAIGVPCISTDCKPGGARTLINNGVNGIIISPNDGDILATKISDVLSNSLFAKKLSNEGIKIRKTHTSKEIFDQWEKFFMNILR